MGAPAGWADEFPGAHRGYFSTVPCLDMTPMPSTNPRAWLTLEPAQRVRLFQLWTELRNPGLRRTKVYIGQRLSFNQWLTQLCLTAACESEQELAETREA